MGAETGDRREDHQRTVVIIGVTPVILAESGHGLQPQWAIEDGHITETFTTVHANVLLARWGELVHGVAKRFGGGVDSVFEAARVLRTPGSINHKVWDAPVPVTLAPIAVGAPITVADLRERLDEFVPEADRHRERARSRPAGDGTVTSEPGGWQWADRTCGYATTVLAGWAKDKPHGRHPWLVSQLVRLDAMHRYGCLTEIDHRVGFEILTARFAELCATVSPVRAVGLGRSNRRRHGRAISSPAQVRLRDQHRAGPTLARRQVRTGPRRSGCRRR